MPISGMILKKDGALSVTGGTDVTFIENGVQVPNGNHVVDAAVTDPRLQPSLTVTNRASTYDKVSGEFSKDKKTVLVKLPGLTASGKLVLNLIRIEREVHPEFVITGPTLLSYGGQACSDADLAAFWTAGGTR